MRVAGLDLGQAVDYSALVVTDSGRVVSLWRSKPPQLSDLLRPLMDMIARDRPAALAFDSSSRIGRDFLRLIAETPVPGLVDTYPIEIRFTSQKPRQRQDGTIVVSKLDLVRTLFDAIRTGRFSCPPFLMLAPALRDELASFRETAREDGLRIYRAAPGKHDDLAMALSLGLWLERHLEDGGVSRFRPMRRTHV